MTALYPDHRKVLQKIISVFVEVFGACGLTVSEKKTEVITMPTPRAPVEKMRIEAAGQRFNQTDTFVDLEGSGSETPDAFAEISRPTRACWMRVKSTPYSCTTVPPYRLTSRPGW